MDVTVLVPVEARYCRARKARGKAGSLPARSVSGPGTRLLVHSPSVAGSRCLRLCLKNTPQTLTLLRNCQVSFPLPQIYTKIQPEYDYSEACEPGITHQGHANQPLWVKYCKIWPSFKKHYVSLINTYPLLSLANSQFMNIFYKTICLYRLVTARRAHTFLLSASCVPCFPLTSWGCWGAWLDRVVLMGRETHMDHRSKVCKRWHSL